MRLCDGDYLGDLGKVWFCEGDWEEFVGVVLDFYGYGGVGWGVGWVVE